MEADYDEIYKKHFKTGVYLWYDYCIGNIRFEHNFILLVVFIVYENL